MNKKEFLDRLRYLLSDLAVPEQEEALLYYEDYFADAGEDKEAEVIASLGSPEQVACQIREGLNKTEAGMFTENGYREKVESDNPPDVYTGNDRNGGQGNGNPDDNEWQYNKNAGRDERQYTGRPKNDAWQNNNTEGNKWQHDRDAGENEWKYSGNSNGSGSQGYYGAADPGRKKKGMSDGMIALLVILGILLSPVLITVAGGILGIVLGILGAVFGIILAAVLVVVCFLAIGIILIVGGFGMVAVRPFGGMICLGIGFLMIAAFLLAVVLLVLLFGKFFPWAADEIKHLGNYLKEKWETRKKGGKMA